MIAAAAAAAAHGSCLSVCIDTAAFAKLTCSLQTQALVLKVVVELHEVLHGQAEKRGGRALIPDPTASRNPPMTGRTVL